MATFDEFRARTLVGSFASIAGVLADHSDAIDSLDPSGGTFDEQAGSDVDRSGGVGVRGVGSDAASTLAVAVDAAGSADDLVSVMSKMGRAADQEAYGAGGRMVADLLSAFAEVSSSADSIDAQRFALVLELAAELMAERQATPRRSGETDSDAHDGSADIDSSGGLASVVAASSVGALRAADQRLPLVEVIIAAADEGLDELESGVAMNPRLATSGVVDAAGAAYLLTLDCFAAIASGDPLPEPPVTAPDPVGSSGTRFRISCVVLPSDTHPHDAHGREPAGDISSWIETCAWLESTLRELAEVEVLETESSRCVVELVTVDAGRVVESICAVGRPTELSIRLGDEVERQMTSTLDEVELHAPVGRSGAL